MNVGEYQIDIRPTGKIKIRSGTGASFGAAPELIAQHNSILVLKIPGYECWNGRFAKPACIPAEYVIFQCVNETRNIYRQLISFPVRKPK